MFFFLKELRLLRYSPLFLLVLSTTTHKTKTIYMSENTQRQHCLCIKGQDTANHEKQKIVLL